jgi:hypothetical protein
MQATDDALRAWHGAAPGEPHRTALIDRASTVEPARHCRRSKSVAPPDSARTA